MKSFNRILIILLIFTIIISTCGAYAASDTTIIYDDITSTQITSGISHDSKGALQSIPIISKMTYNGLAYTEADLTNISRPATIKKISVIRNEETPDNGIVYIDDLRFLKDGMFLARDVIIPKIPPIRMLITLQILKGVKHILFQFSAKTRVNKFIT